MTESRTLTPSRAPSQSRALLPTLVFVTLVVSIISSLGAPLIPTIATETGVSLATAQWILTVTLLVGAIATPILGRLGDGRRRREAALTALVLVVVGAVLAALPLSFAALIAGRGLMGVGLALTPLAMAAARDAIAGQRGRRAIAMLSVSTATGIGLGYPLTSLVAEVWSFRAAFWFGAAIAAVALVAAIPTFPRTPDRPPRRLDLVSCLLVAPGLALLLLAMSQYGTWTGQAVAVIAATALVLLAAWIVREVHSAAPLVNLRLVILPGVLAADLIGFFGTFGVYTTMTVSIRFVQTPTDAGYGFGQSVFVAGLTLVPLSVFTVAANRLTGPLARRFGPDLILPLGCFLFAAAGATFLLAHSSLWQIFLIMGIGGLAMGCTSTAMPGLIVRSVPADETSSAMSFNQVLRFLGGAVGSALTATVLENHTPVGAHLPTLDGYVVIVWTSMISLVLAGIVAAVLQRRARGHDVDRADAALLEEESMADAYPIGAPRTNET